MNALSPIDPVAADAIGQAVGHLECAIKRANDEGVHWSITEPMVAAATQIAVARALMQRQKETV